jgi:thioredoxin-like negative regulator of GroEL
VNSYDEAAARRAAASGPDDVDAQLKVADLDLANGRIEEALRPAARRRPEDVR